MYWGHRLSRDTVFAVAFQNGGKKEATSILAHLVSRKCLMRLVVPYPGVLSLGKLPPSGEGWAHPVPVIS